VKHDTKWPGRVCQPADIENLESLLNVRPHRNSNALIRYQTWGVCKYTILDACVTFGTERICKPILGSFLTGQLLDKTLVKCRPVLTAPYFAISLIAVPSSGRLGESPRTRLGLGRCSLVADKMCACMNWDESV
jgi:hypothetical protein